MTVSRQFISRGAMTLTMALVCPAFAVDVVYEPTTYKNLLEAQGFNGRIDLPTSVSLVPSGSNGSVTPVASTGCGTVLYTLAGNGYTLITSNAETGAYIGQVTLSTQLSDIAYTNGQLYGIADNYNLLKIVGIPANGITQSVFVQSGFSTSYWQLSGAANGDALLATSNGQAGYVINPAAGQQTSTLIVPSTGTENPQTVINSAGNLFTVMGGSTSTEPTATFPNGVAQGNRSASTAYTPNVAISDEFSLSYPSSQSAIAQPSSSSIYTGAMDGLVRNPQILNLASNISLSNGLTPDATTLSNLTPTSLNPSFTGPTTPTYQQTLAPSGNFAAGTPLGQLNVTLNLATAQRGIYDFTSQPAMTADYAYGGAVDHGRAVQSYTTTIADFAYDPISANLVGNGDASLLSAGWESQFANLGWQSDSAPPDQINHGFSFLPLSGDPYELRQFLQLPTPASAMMLTFSDHVIFSGSITMQVYLNSVLVASLTTSSVASEAQQFLINNPALENLTDAPLMFEATLNSGLAQIQLDNITLMAVPEPATISAGILGLALLSCRARRR